MNVHSVILYNNKCVLIWRNTNKSSLIFLLKNNACKFDGPFKLKSGRMSPYFINTGDLSDGDALRELCKYYAYAIKNSGIGFDTIFGPSYKGSPLAVATAIVLSSNGINVGYSFDRKEAKIHGDATREEKKKQMIVGRLNDNDRVVEIDDVMTTGQTKYDSRKLLGECATGLSFPGLFISTDRQELDEYGNYAIEEFMGATGTSVFPIITASDILDYLVEHEMKNKADDMKTYLKAWSINSVRDKYDLYDKPLVQGGWLIPACDVDDIKRFEAIVSATHDIDKIAGYKLGFELALLYGLPRLVEIIKNKSPNKRIY